MPSFMCEMWQDICHGHFYFENCDRKSCCTSSLTRRRSLHTVHSQSYRGHRSAGFKCLTLLSVALTASVLPGKKNKKQNIDLLMIVAVRKCATSVSLFVFFAASRIVDVAT